MGVLLPLVILGLGFGAARSEIQRIERDAAADLASQLRGEEKSVRVRTTLNGPFGAFFSDIRVGTITAERFETDGLPLFVEPERSQAGFLRELRLELRDFRLRGLRVESLRATIPECRFDRELALRRRQIRLSRSGIGTGEVRIRQEDLAEFIPRKVKEIKRCLVRLDRGKVWVEGYGEFLVAKTEFLVVADLKIVDGTQLHLDNARVVFGWQKADAFAQKVLLDAMNPVVDLRRDLGLFDAFQFERVTLRDGFLTATGTTRIPVRPTPAPGSRSPAPVAK